MLRALGLRLLDADGQALEEGGLALAKLAHIDASGLDPRLAGVQFEVAADVDNPLCGANGASAIFGPQKGANPQQVEALDHALNHFADHCALLLGADVRDYPGCGAAGGMGFAARAFMDAQFRPGVEVVAELAGLDALAQGADLVVTGEGVSMPRHCAARRRWGWRGLPSAMACRWWYWPGPWGGYQQLYAHGVDAVFALANGPMSLEQACANAAELLQARACDIGRLWRCAKRG